MTRILITGATGFIAHHLAPILQAARMTVIGTSRHEAAPGFERVHACRLGESLAGVLAAERPDAIVHTALDAGPNAYALNVAGTRRWREEAAAAGVSLQIFLSSLSAMPDAPSAYGRAKYDLERDFLAADGIVLRMGVVVGDGGMFGRMVASARRIPVTPLLNGGVQLVYVLGIDFLCTAIRDCIAADGAGLRGRAWNIQQPQPYTLRQMIEAINCGYGLRRLLLPIPAQPILAAVRLAERLRLPGLPVGSANIEGLLRQGQQRIPSDFARFGYPEQPLAELVRAATTR